MTDLDRKNLAAAALMGDYRTMSQTAIAQRAIIAVLMDESMPLTDFHRHGLLVALDELVSTLEERAGYLEDEGYIGGGES